VAGSCEHGNEISHSIKGGDTKISTHNQITVTIFKINNDKTRSWSISNLSVPFLQERIVEVAMAALTNTLTRAHV
jgi:hypothetical protein